MYAYAKAYIGLNLTIRYNKPIINNVDAGWSSLEARRAHNPEVIGSNPIPATRCVSIVPS